MRIDSSGNTIGSALRRARIDAGYSQTGLARMIGVSDSCLNRVEHGTRTFDTDWMSSMPDGIRDAVRRAIESEVASITGTES